MEIKMDQIINLDKVKGDVNLLLFNSKLFNTQDMQEVNKIVEGLKDVKIQIHYN